MNFRSSIVKFTGFALAVSLSLAACDRFEAAADRGTASADAARDTIDASQPVEIRPRVAGYVDRIGFEAGAMVKKGQILFRIDPRPFREETERQYIARTHAISDIELAKADRARTQRLVGGGTMAPEEVERLANQERAAADHLATATAALAAAKVDLELTEVRAPIDGRASRSLIKQGDLVSSGALLTTVSANEALSAANRDPQSMR